MTEAAKTLNDAVGKAIVHISQQRERIKELEHLVKESFLELEEKEELINSAYDEGYEDGYMAAGE